MDKLKYSVDTNEETGEKSTSFTLAAGTTFELGSEIVELSEDAKVFISKPMGRDAVVETISGAKQAGPNAANFAYTEKREGVTYDATYGGRGQRIEAVREPEPEPEAESEAEPKKSHKKSPKK